jgi:hypothetical protein
MLGLRRNDIIEEHSASGTEAGHTSLKLDNHSSDRMIGNRMCEGQAAPAKTRLRAMRGCCHFLHPRRADVVLHGRSGTIGRAVVETFRIDPGPPPVILEVAV